MNLKLNVFEGYSRCAKYTLFILFMVVSFTVMFVPTLLATFYEDKSEDFVMEAGNSLVETTKQRRPMPNHNPEDFKLVRELFSKLIPPAKKSHVSPNDIPFPNKLITNIRSLTDYKRAGYFIEVGSGDKEFFSDTFFLEQRLGWTGLLVEPDTINLKNFHRNAWIAPACMSLNNSAYEYHYQPYIYYPTHSREEPVSSHSSKVICYPFYTFWLALNRPVIDYFAIDVGGGEVEILETIPFDKVEIKILHIDYSKARGGFMGVTTLLQRNGFKVVSEFLPDYLFFIKKEYKRHYDEI